MYFEKNFWLQLFESLIEFSNDMKEMTTLAKAKRKCIFSRYGMHAGVSIQGELSWLVFCQGA